MGTDGAGSGRLSDVAMVQATDFGDLNDPAAFWRRMKFCTSATATWTTSRARRQQAFKSRGSTAIVGHVTPMCHSLISKFLILPGC